MESGSIMELYFMEWCVCVFVFIVYACAGWIKNTRAQIWPGQIYWRDDALWHISNEWHKSCSIYFLLSMQQTGG